MAAGEGWSIIFQPENFPGAIGFNSQFEKN